MHSRIFQLERSIDNIDSNYICEEDFYDIDASYRWFIGSIADYVDEDTDKQADIDWFIATLSQQTEFITVSDNGNEYEVSITFLPGFKNAYFERRYYEFKNRVGDMTLETFTDDGIYTIERLMRERFSFYIYSSYYGLIPLDDFVRQLNNYESNTFYFGTTLDYHF